MPTHESFSDFIKRRVTASKDYISGRSDTMLSMNAMDDPVTFFPANGKVVQGAERVNDATRQTARTYSGGSKIVHYEILQSGSDVEMGFWSGIVHAELALKDQSEPSVRRLRITEVFRRDENGWKLVHRHTDQMKD